MLIRFATNLSKIISTNKQHLNQITKAKRISLLNQNTYYFSQSSQEKILRELNEQIEYYRNNLTEQGIQNKQYFIKQGWQIIYDQTQTLYQFTKSTLKFDIKIFTHVKADPISQPNKDQELYLNANKKQQKLKYAQLLIWIKKKQAKKWMVSQLRIIEEEIALSTIHFTGFAPGVGWQRYVYAGPDIMSLPDNLMKAINSIFQKLDLNVQLLMNMIYFASGKANQLDYKWLQDFKQIVN